MHFKRGRQSKMTDDERTNEIMVSEMCKGCNQHQDVCICSQSSNKEKEGK